jgi:two-component system chemotaxis response regulator CheB
MTWMEKKKINVLIVEDSLTAQKLLNGILASDPGFNVLGVVTNGKQAVDAVARLNPDVVSMDIYMPEMDGLEATRRIMEKTPVPIVIVSSYYQPSDMSMSFSILKAGALTILPRPVGPMHPDYLQSSRSYLNTLRMMAGIKVTNKRSKHVSQPTISRSVISGSKPISYNGTENRSIVAIGASAGGPMALQTIMSQIPGDFSLPILIVQHIDANFAVGFCNWLNSTSGVPVKIASHGEKLMPGYAYLPPGDAHLGLIDEGSICVSHDPPESNLRPSVNYLFRSVRRVYGGKAIAILLSGMGTDGAKELKQLKDVGALTIAQDELSSLVHGMPGEAILLEAVCSVSSLEEIVSQIIKN